MNEDPESRVAAGAANFGECLVEGSAGERQNGRKIKRRAIAISIALESAGLTALLIAPMLAKPAEIRMTRTIPIPPYTAARTPHASTDRPVTFRRPCVFCPAGPIAPIAASSVDRHVNGIDEPSKDDFLTRTTGAPDGLAMDDRRNQPKPPIEPPRQKTRIYEPHINPALLTHRVEPVFPALARQIRKSGRVELRAVIAADGTIQSLEVMSGDPIFLPSAIEAVRQWRYKPTLLNGQPVEVDTFITVIYTLNSW
jgi:periplasmic protein TonB